MRKSVVALALALAAPVAMAQNVKIGVVTFLSGPAAAPFGVPAKNAAEFVVEQLNAVDVSGIDPMTSVVPMAMKPMMPG